MKNQLQLIISIFLIIFVLCVFLWSRKYKKDDLAKYYKVSRPTLQKWSLFFPHLIPAEKWKSKRIFTSEEYMKIKNTWGSDSGMVLSKKQIVQMAESSYKTVAQNVKINLDKIGITLDAWESCSVFPPVISKRILEVLG